MRNFMDLHRAFEILEIEENASLPEIKRAYRDLTQVWHPDRHTGNPHLYGKALEKMKEINAAYDCVVSFLEHKAKISQHTRTASPAEDEYAFLICPNCQAINRVPEGYSINTRLRCGRCGFSIHRKESESREANWSQRTLCGDGDCIGVIGPSGKCNICGKSYFEGKKSDEHKTNLRNEEFQKRIRK
jgi:curved DNA-binding protein CbpA